MNMPAPRKLHNWIRSRLDARYSLGSVRRIPNSPRFSQKRPATTYSSAAGAETVRRWQADAAGIIRAARRRRFRVVVQDESIFARIGTNGGKIRSRIGDPVTVVRGGRRDRMMVVYGVLADDGTRLMRKYERFDGPTFVRYLREARRRWGKILIIMDNASQHKSKDVKEYL